MLSAVIITFNEEKNIATCLNSLLTVADEIVVVDSFSTDKTREICESFPKVRFLTHPFEGHIEQKNFALQQARFDYILSLDADEALSDEAIRSVLEVKKNFTADAYTFSRLTSYCGKWIRHGGWYPDRKLRMAMKNKVIWQGINPHDELCLLEKGTIVHLKGDILHYSVKSIDDHLNTIYKFSRIAAEHRFQKGIKSGWFKILVHPLWKFVKIFFIRAGFLDGYYGFLIARLSAFSTFLRYIRLRELWKQKIDHERNH